MPKLLARASGSKSNVTIQVNGQPWKLVSSFAGAGPRDRVFTVRTSTGETVVQFGDGVHGALPPVEGKITVRHKRGGGAGGDIVTASAERKVSGSADEALSVAIRIRACAISFEFSGKQQCADSRKR